MYALSTEQERFIAEAEQKGYKVDLDYSNKYEKGTKCPAVHLKNIKDIIFTGRNVQWNKTSSGYVVYAPY
jgi:hypothetical protein